MRFSLSAVFGLLFLAGSGTGCNNNKAQILPSPKGYNLSRPRERKLPIELDEISGLFYHAADNSLFAIQDERGLLYKIFPDEEVAIERWKFADGGDFEEVIVWDDAFYVLKSNGNISCFKFDAAGEPVGQELPFPFGKGNEFEAMYADPKLGKIVIICKDCVDDKKKEITTWLFDPKSLQFDSSALKIDAEGVAGALGQKSIRFKPSGAAIHPLTGELYIISAVNKMLIVTDRQGRTQSIYKLPVQYFKQPEGIAFSPKGTLYISNEAADIGVANVLIFDYQRPVIQ